MADQIRAPSELIERLGSATEPNFDLECAIFETVLPTEWFGSKVESWFRQIGHVYGCNTADGCRHLDALRAPNYTASLDAALSLKPAEAHYHLGDCNEDGLPWACVTDAEGRDFVSTGATPILALCIAAMKARASLI